MEGSGSEVGFSLARCLPGSHARFRIFIRHHDILCSAHSLAEADSTPRRSLGRLYMRDTVSQLPRISLFLGTSVNRAKMVHLGDALSLLSRYYCSRARQWAGSIDPAPYREGGRWPWRKCES